MNCPLATARRRSIAGAASSSISSVCSIITTASAPRGMTPPVAIAVAVPGVTSIAGCTPQAITSALSARRRGARVAGAGGVGGAHRKAVDIGAIERRRIDRRDHVGGKHARRAPRRAARSRRRSGERSMHGLEAPARLCGRDHFEELLLPRGAPHRVEDRVPSPDRPAGAPVSRYLMAMVSPQPASRPEILRCRRNDDPAVAARQRLERQIAGRRAVPPCRRRSAPGSVRSSPIVEVTLRLSGSAVGIVFNAAAGKPGDEMAPDQKPDRQRGIEPPRHQQHRPLCRQSRTPRFRRAIRQCRAPRRGRAAPASRTLRRAVRCRCRRRQSPHRFRQSPSAGSSATELRSDQTTCFAGGTDNRYQRRFDHRRPRFATARRRVFAANEPSRPAFRQPGMTAMSTARARSPARRNGFCGVASPPAGNTPSPAVTGATASTR